jgi:hypothetical protein
MGNFNNKTPFYKSIEEKNGWIYVGVLMIGTSYYLSGPNPFEQWNEFSFYLSENGPQYCRRAETNFTFTYNKEGKYLVFKSDKHDETDLRCEQMHWIASELTPERFRKITFDTIDKLNKRGISNGWGCHFKCVSSAEKSFIFE